MGGGLARATWEASEPGTPPGWLVIGGGQGRGWQAHPPHHVPTTFTWESEVADVVVRTGNFGTVLRVGKGMVVKVAVTPEVTTQKLCSAVAQGAFPWG